MPPSNCGHTADDRIVGHIDRRAGTAGFRLLGAAGSSSALTGAAAREPTTNKASTPAAIAVTEALSRGESQGARGRNIHCSTPTAR